MRIRRRTLTAAAAVAAVRIATTSTKDSNAHRFDDFDRRSNILKFERDTNTDLYQQQQDEDDDEEAEEQQTRRVEAISSYRTGLSQRETRGSLKRLNISR